MRVKRKVEKRLADDAEAFVKAVVKCCDHTWMPEYERYERSRSWYLRVESRRRRKP